MAEGTTRRQRSAPRPIPAARTYGGGRFGVPKNPGRRFKITGAMWGITAAAAPRPPNEAQVEVWANFVVFYIYTPIYADQNVDFRPFSRPSCCRRPVGGSGRAALQPAREPLEHHDAAVVAARRPPARGPRGLGSPPLPVAAGGGDGNCSVANLTIAEVLAMPM
jgi:hypothetical protein